MHHTDHEKLIFVCTSMGTFLGWLILIFFPDIIILYPLDEQPSPHDTAIGFGQEKHKEERKTFY